jgi:ketosteroid isomerase-like protein
MLVSAQTTEQEINDQVWKPFTKALMTQDGESFMAVHSKDIIRVERDGKKIFGFNEYNSKTLENWPKWKESLAKSGTKRTFELRFLERFANGDLAHEVGYFKNESISTTGEIRSSYGKFHVVLRKENGIWKILVDSDSNEGGTITEEMFQAAKPL